jgi:hypothetical protein
MPLAERRGKRHASRAPAALQSNVSRSVPSPGHTPGDDETNFSQGVVPWRVPGLVTERANCWDPATAASAAWAETKTAWHPCRDTKTLFSLHPLKSVLVSRPQAGLFSILHARALFPPRSVPNCKQTGVGYGGAVAQPNSFDQEAQNCPIQGMANNGRGADAPYFKGIRNGGLILARNAPSIVQPVCACQCIARPVPSALHIDSARQAWGLCF